jgi:hypothetical protein
MTAIHRLSVAVRSFASWKTCVLFFIATGVLVSRLEAFAKDLQAVEPVSPASIIELIDPLLSNQHHAHAQS